MCLEINMLAVIPLLISGGAKNRRIISVKYFISQRVASLLFICLLVVAQETSVIRNIVGLVIIFKLALPPFQGWMLRLLENINYLEMWLLFTIQKLIPLVILTQLETRAALLILMAGVVTIFVGGVINRVISLNLLLFISSVINTIWIVSVSVVSLIWVTYMLLYGFMLLMVIVILKLVKVYKMNDILNVPQILSVLMGLHFFNLGGVPPLTGFLAKLIIIKYLTGVRVGLILLLVLNSLILLFIYTRVFYQLYCATPYQIRYILNLRIAPQTRAAFLRLGGRLLFLWLII